MWSGSRRKAFFRMQLHIFTSPQDFRLKQKFILAPAEFLTQLGGKQIILIICKITEKFRSFVRPMTRLISLLSTVFQMTRHKSWVKTNDCRQVKRRKCKLTWIFYYIINHSRTWHEFLKSFFQEIHLDPRGGVHHDLSLKIPHEILSTIRLPT